MVKSWGRLPAVGFRDHVAADGSLLGVAGKWSACGWSFVAQKALWNIARDKKLEDRGAFPEEDGHQLRKYRAMLEENFLSSWLREDVEVRIAEMEKWNEEAKQEESKSGKREVEREEERMVIKRRCVNRVPAMSSRNFVPFMRWNVLGILVVFWCVSLLCVVLSGFDCEFVESQSFSFSGKRQAFFIESRGVMGMEETREKTPPESRRRIHTIGGARRSVKRS